MVAHFSLDFHFYIQWAPLNVITMGPKETDDINRMITIIECIMQAMSELGWSTFIKTQSISISISSKRHTNAIDVS